ncbi:MAG: hypothetical protein JWQ20_4184 [Conexibacter sp.]|nr:hypothetical protein [Conexibacter sp.]
MSMGRSVRIELGGRRGRALAAACAAACAAGPASASAGADTTPPTAPPSLAASAVTATSATLGWGRSIDDVGVEGYRLYRGPAGAPESSLRQVTTVDTVQSYVARNLSSGKSYTFGLIAIDAADNASAMTTTTVTTSASTDTVAPSPPASGTVFVRPFSSTRLDISWAPAPDADVAAYQVLRDGAVIATIDLPSGLRYSDNAVAPSTSHVYAIRTIDATGNVSAPTPGRRGTTPPTGTVLITRGPYLSNVDGTSAIVSWWTNLPTPGVVGWGTATEAEHSVTDPAGTVQHHAVKITGLLPGTTYRYEVGDGAGVAGVPSTFPTMAPPGATFSFAAIGDFGGGSLTSAQNAANLASSSTAFIQTVGDNIYPSAGLPDPDYSTTYSDFDARFFNPFRAAISRQAFFPANGNKEYYSHGEFWAAFPMPGANHSWYSYNWGDAHILVLDSELPISAGTPQHDFAKADLIAHHGDKWLIVAMQKPPYSSSSAGSSYELAQQQLVPLFEQQDVDLVLSGNSHNYERTHPLIGGAPAAGGVTYIVSGAGGGGFNKFTIPAPGSTAFRSDAYGEFVRVSVSPTTIVADAIRADTNTVLDTTTLTNAKTTAAPTPADSTPPPAPTPADTTPPPAPSSPGDGANQPAADVPPAGTAGAVSGATTPPKPGVKRAALPLLPAATWLRQGVPIRVRHGAKVLRVSSSTALLALPRRAPTSTVAFRVYRRVVGAGTPFRAVGRAKPGRRFLDRGLHARTRYEYVIVAIDRRGRQSAPSPRVRLTTVRRHAR